MDNRFNQQTVLRALVQMGTELSGLLGAIAAGFGMVWFAGAVIIDWHAIDPKAAQMVAVLTAVGLAFGLIIAISRAVANKSRTARGMGQRLG